MAKDLSKLELIRQMLESAEHSIKSANQLLAEVMGISSKSTLYEKARDLSISGEGKIIEGVFDGENMVGPDSKKYPVPANYASKSKLVPGDVLKLTILEDGSFIFKQIGPIERKKIIGILTEEEGKYKVLANGKGYNVLLASVTYFKAKTGDQITLVVPKNGVSEWGAIENVIISPEEKKEKQQKNQENDKEKEKKKEKGK